MPNENAEGAQGKAEDAQELSANQESADNGAEPDGAGAEDAQDAGSGNGSEDEPSDKHGQPGINREKYKRDIAERDAKIAELSAKVDEAAKSADAREKLKREIEELRRQGAERDTEYRLQLAGCVNVKAARAVLDDYDGDVSKLKAGCPYLFQQRQTGSTGGKPAGASHGIDERIDAVFSRR
ncbi:MAG: hypothetical protein SOI38_01090 [Eggerthellaceae bacterium]